MKYSDLLSRLNEYKETIFASFQRKLIPTNQTILGVRTPIMRRIAKEYTGSLDELLAFPDEYFEVTFIKLTVVSALPYEDFVKYVERCVALIDNWATCDCFKTKAIKKHKAEFLPVLERIFSHGGEFFERYALITLLSEYIEEDYLLTIESYITRADTKSYYIHMAVAWLTAEILVKYYEYGVRLLKKGVLDIKTHNKAIQKATESYRLTNERKAYLRSLKIKKHIG